MSVNCYHCHKYFVGSDPCVCNQLFQPATEVEPTLEQYASLALRHAEEEITRLRAENEALRKELEQLKNVIDEAVHQDSLKPSYDWITLPCAPGRLPNMGDLVVIQTRNQYFVGPWSKLFDLGSQILRFKIIERASK